MLLLDGRNCSKNRLARLREEIASLGAQPRLVVVRVGEDPASKVYVQKKTKTCKEVGFESEEIHLDTQVSQEELLKRVQSLNEDRAVHGILVQLPLPEHINSNLIIESIDPSKDVDGFHPYNLGRLLAREDGFVPCTPLGIMNLLKDYEIDVKGKRAVVVGRSKIVGRPMSILLDNAGATVTVVHRKTLNPREHTSEADILVAAAGQRHFLGRDDLKKGAVAIDVGIHRDPKTNKLTGDLRFDELKEHVSAISPVPGGVGPMTICSLLENTVQAFKKQQSLGKQK